jgi:hypothetical protein
MQCVIYHYISLHSTTICMTLVNTGIKPHELATILKSLQLAHNATTLIRT